MMGMKLYAHINGGGPDIPLTGLEEMFNYGVRFQVLTRTEEQKDFISALQLMYGREIQIETWAEWNERRQAYEVTCGGRLRLLPVVFTTFHANLRGL